jgi:hypothetical protein
MITTGREASERIFFTIAGEEQAHLSPPLKDPAARELKKSSKVFQLGMASFRSSSRIWLRSC